MKTCNKCRQIKSVDDFYRHHPTTKDGLYTYCKSCIKEISRLWKTNNGNRDYQKEYKNRNKEKLRCNWRKTDRKRRLIDKMYVLNSRMRNLIFVTLRGKKRGVSWKKLVNYTLNDLIRHLESKFTDGMSWKKFMEGKIHIDHIIPKSFFVFENSGDVEFRMCWRLENLQPLWAKDNIMKTNKLSLKG